MKQLWRRAAGIIKDRNTILISNLMLITSQSQRHKNPELQRSVIRATSHDDSCVDYNQAQRVFTWVRTSPSHLILFLSVIGRRIERTRDWVVALKSLILLHGVLCTNAPGTRKIGRLPFDLSGFQEGYIRDGTRREALSKFVQAYFLFVDLKSVTLSAELKDEMALPMMVQENDRIRVQMDRIKGWQNLLDAVLLVNPSGTGITDQVVVLEAMDCMVIEVFELYSKICDGIAKALMKIYANCVGKLEASIALELLHKANKQGQDLFDYFELCQKIGLLDVTECPKIQHIPEEDFLELEKIINGNGVLLSEEFEGKDENINEKPLLKTVITDKWEVFEEDTSKVGKEEGGDLVLVDHLSVPVIHFNPFIDYVEAQTPSQNILSLL